MPEEAGQGEQQRAGGEGDAGDGGHGWCRCRVGEG